MRTPDATVFAVKCYMYSCVHKYNCIYSCNRYRDFRRISFVLCYKRTARAQKAHNTTSAAIQLDSGAYPLYATWSP